MDALKKIANDSDRHLPQELGAECYSYLVCSETIADLKQRVEQSAVQLGFSTFIYFSLECVDKKPPVLCNVPLPLVTAYYSQRLYLNDMNLQRVRENVLPFYHATIHDYVSRAPFKSDMTRCMHTIFELNKQYGFYDYFVMPVNSRFGQRRCALVVTQRGLSPVELKSAVVGRETALRALAEAIDNVIARRFAELCHNPAVDGMADVSINPKPLRVLEALANNDVTINDVAEKLSISVVTANQHLKTVRKALGVKTNYAAIKKAIMANLIEFKSPKKFKRIR